MTRPPFLDQIAPGVLGYTVENERGLFVPAIMAEREGSGDVGRYLDGLPRDVAVRVPNVMNPRLAGMLERRGFKLVEEYAPEWGEHVPVYLREAT